MFVCILPDFLAMTEQMEFAIAIFSICQVFPKTNQFFLKSTNAIGIHVNWLSFMALSEMMINCSHLMKHSEQVFCSDYIVCVH